MDLEFAKANIAACRRLLEPYSFDGKAGDAEYYRIRKEYYLALRTRDEIVQAPALPDDNHLTLLPDVALWTIFRYLPNTGNILDKVCRRWWRIWRREKKFNTLRSNNRFLLDKPIEFRIRNLKHNLNLAKVCTMVAGCDRNIWIQNDWNVFVIDPASLAIVKYFDSGDNILIGGSAEGTPMFLPELEPVNLDVCTVVGGYYDEWLIRYVNNDELRVYYGEYNTSYILLARRSPASPPPRFSCNGVGLYATSFGKNGGCIFIRYADKTVVDIGHIDTKCRVDTWMVIVPGTNTMIKWSEHALKWKGMKIFSNFDRWFSAVCMVGAHLVVLSTSGKLGVY